MKKEKVISLNRDLKLLEEYVNAKAKEGKIVCDIGSAFITFRNTEETFFSHREKIRVIDIGDMEYALLKIIEDDLEKADGLTYIARNSKVLIFSGTEDRLKMFEEKYLGELQQANTGTKRKNMPWWLIIILFILQNVLSSMDVYHIYESERDNLIAGYWVEVAIFAVLLGLIIVARYKLKQPANRDSEMDFIKWFNQTSTWQLINDVVQDLLLLMICVAIGVLIVN